MGSSGLTPAGPHLSCAGDPRAAGISAGAVSPEWNRGGESSLSPAAHAAGNEPNMQVVSGLPVHMASHIKLLIY